MGRRGLPRQVERPAYFHWLLRALITCFWADLWIHKALWILWEIGKHSLPRQEITLKQKMPLSPLLPHWWVGAEVLGGWWAPCSPCSLLTWGFYEPTSTVLRLWYWHLLPLTKPSFVPGTVLIVLHGLFHWISTVTLWGRLYFIYIGRDIYR